MPPKKQLKTNKIIDYNDSDVDDKIDDTEDVEVETDYIDNDLNDDVEENEENDDNDEMEENYELDDNEIEEDDNGEKKYCIIEKTLEEDNEYFDNDDDIEIQQDTTIEYVKKEDRVSAPRLTKYEMVRIIGERTKQLTMGAKPLIKVDIENNNGNYYETIAINELKLNMVPFKIRRPLPNGKFELWLLEELNKSHLVF